MYVFELDVLDKIVYFPSRQSPLLCENRMCIFGAYDPERVHRSPAPVFT
jgi:hypothetical protein